MSEYKNIRLLTSTLIGCIAMLIPSYCWHGLILNDFSSLQYNPNIYLWLLFILYLFVSFSISFIISIYNPDSNKLAKHIFIGGFLGFLIYFIAFVLGVSFNKGGLEHIVLDFIWQMTEQGIGSMVISLFYTLVYRYDKLKKMNSFD
jgi:hypothetical protein